MRRMPDCCKGGPWQQAGREELMSSSGGSVFEKTGRSSIDSSALPVTPRARRSGNELAIAVLTGQQSSSVAAWYADDDDSACPAGSSQWKAQSEAQAIASQIRLPDRRAPRARTNRVRRGNIAGYYAKPVAPATTYPLNESSSRYGSRNTTA
jgi:hypothetical protein